MSASAAATSPAVLAPRLRRLRGAGADALRELSGRIAAAAAAHAAGDRRRLRVCRRADDFADEPGYSAARAPPAARRLAAAARCGRRRHGQRRQSPNDLIFVAVADAIREHDLPVSLFSDLLSAFRQDVTTKPLRALGRRAGLLLALGEPGRPAGAAHRRLSRRGARSIVGRAVHGAAADQLLAGFRARLAERAALRSARGLRVVRRPRARSRSGACGCIRERRSIAASPLPAEWRARPGGDGAADATAVQRGPPGVRARRRPAALRASPDLARRRADSRAASSVRISTCCTGRRSAPAMRGSILWRAASVDRCLSAHPWPATPASTTRSSCCPPPSGSAIVACLGLLPCRGRCGGRGSWRGRGEGARRARADRLVAARARPLLRRRHAGKRAGPRARAADRAIQSAAAPLRRADRRRRDGSRHPPLRDVRRSLRVLHSRRVGRRA